jgi:hypothetical protein
MTCPSPLIYKHKNILSNMNTNTYKPIRRSLGALVVVGQLLFHGQALAQAPHIVTHPLTHTVCPGATVHLEVVATGELPMTYQWIRNGMTTYTNVTLNQNSCTLVLTNMTTNLAGYFYVRVINASGNQYSHYAYITVLDPGVETNGFGLTIRALTNTTWRIECTTNLVGGANWFTLTNLTIPRSPAYIHYVDREGTNLSRLYRVVPTTF